MLLESRPWKESKMNIYLMAYPLGKTSGLRQASRDRASNLKLY